MSKIGFLIAWAVSSSLLVPGASLSVASEVGSLPLVKKLNLPMNCVQCRGIQPEMSRGNINGQNNVMFTLRSGAEAANEPLPPKSWAFNVGSYANKNFFLVGMFVAVALAKMFPGLGVDKGILRPELVIGKYGVAMIFLLSGLSLQTSELTNAASNIKVNGMIQTAIFALWPFFIGAPVKHLLTQLFPSLLPASLVDGILIMSCLPTTVNMCIMLTSASGGNVATSICNAVISNMAGIVVTPALLLRFFGTTIKLPFVDMVLKLCQKVLLPVAIGQALRATPAKRLYSSNSKIFKRAQEVVLLGIVWNAFCNAFSSGLGLELKHSLLLLALLPSLHLGSFGVLFNVFKHPLFNLSRGEVVAASFCASQKTLAFGLPLVNTIFEGNTNLAAYCAPIMFIHPLQMTVGSLLLPALSKWTQAERNDTTS